MAIWAGLYTDCKQMNARRWSLGDVHPESSLLRTKNGSPSQCRERCARVVHHAHDQPDARHASGYASYGRRYAPRRYLPR